MICQDHPFGAVFGQEENLLFSFTLGLCALESFSYSMGAERYPSYFSPALVVPLKDGLPSCLPPGVAKLSII
jgi:hypothetical protein